jgi:hypothetical protein
MFGRHMRTITLKLIVPTALVDVAIKMGVQVQWQVEVISADFAGTQPKLTVRDQAGVVSELWADFVLDASGFGRILPKGRRLG